MALHDLLQNDRMAMLKWVSERNVHVPLADLAFMLDLSHDILAGANNDPVNSLYDYHAD